MSEDRVPTSDLIEFAESDVSTKLASELEPHMSLLRDLTNAAGALIEEVESAPGAPRAIHACAFLLARLVTDLQAVGHLARRGYVAPALSLTAGMLEMAHTSMYIGADETRATKWLQHDDMKTAAPWGTFDMIQGAAKSIPGLNVDTVQREWEVIYKTSCMAKHGNPLALAQVGYVIKDDANFIIAGPHLSERVRAWAHMALGYALRYVHLGLRIPTKLTSDSERR